MTENDVYNVINTLGEIRVGFSQEDMEEFLEEKSGQGKHLAGKWQHHNRDLPMLWRFLDLGNRKALAEAVYEHMENLAFADGAPTEAEMTAERKEREG